MKSVSRGGEGEGTVFHLFPRKSFPWNSRLRCSRHCDNFSGRFKNTCHTPLNIKCERNAVPLRFSYFRLAEADFSDLVVPLAETFQKSLFVWKFIDSLKRSVIKRPWNGNPFDFANFKLTVSPTFQKSPKFVSKFVDFPFKRKSYWETKFFQFYTFETETLALSFVHWSFQQERKGKMPETFQKLSL